MESDIREFMWKVQTEYNRVEAQPATATTVAYRECLSRLSACCSDAISANIEYKRLNLNN
jgi:hypothetical protein